MVPLGVFSVAREPVTLVHPIGIRTWGELGFKLPLWRLTFQNYTKSKKYEALKKNAVPGDKPPAHRSQVQSGL
jgi:hypothetical protein